MQRWIKKAVFELSLFCTEAIRIPWWVKISDAGLYLGGIPLRNKGHLVQLKSLGINRVLNLLEPFEREPGLRHQPVTKEEWEKSGAVIFEVPSKDFRSISAKKLTQAAAIVAQELKQGHKMYVHCKAGMGRSASVVIAYLILHEGLSADEAIMAVKKRRRIKISSKQVGILQKLEPARKKINC
ncbi:MAG: dual specificity protein phosphatase family protein [Myxococcota bacterium]